MTESNQAPASATLSFPGGTAELPILPSVDGPGAIDVSTLTKQTGYTALDYGFNPPCKTDIQQPASIRDHPCFIICEGVA